MIASEWLLDVIVPGKPVGAMRPRATIRGVHAGVYNPAKHTNTMAFACEYFRRGWKRTPEEVEDVRSELAGIGGVSVITVNEHRPPLDEPVTVEMDAIMERPRSLLKEPTRRSAGSPRRRIPCVSKPDASNVAKLYEDALVRAGVLRDDSRVVRLVITKMYAAIGEQPHVRVRVARWVP